MEQSELLQRTVGILERLGLRYFVTGSMAPTPDFDATFSSAEDVILKKMEAYLEGGSEKHLRDIAGVLRISGAALDRVYIEDWADRMGTSEIWQEVLKKSIEIR